MIYVGSVEGAWKCGQECSKTWAQALYGMEQVEIRGPILSQDSQCVVQLHKEAIHFSSELKHTFTYNEDHFLIL